VAAPKWLGGGKHHQNPNDHGIVAGQARIEKLSPSVQSPIRLTAKFP
jgi:hypothetical protein